MNAERRVICTDEEVRGLLERRKTQLRRPIRDAHGAFWDHTGYQLAMWPSGHWRFVARGHDEPAAGSPAVWCPFGVAGDVLSVREAWYCDHIAAPRAPVAEMLPLVYYRARDLAPCGATFTGFSGETMRNPWRSAACMPAWAVRCKPVLRYVRPQRLHDISPDEARDEGWRFLFGPGLRFRTFDSWWDGSRRCGGLGMGRRAPWSSNPWVWALTVEMRRDAEVRS